jgi:hypothetical protein
MTGISKLAFEREFLKPWRRGKSAHRKVFLVDAAAGGDRWNYFPEE